MKPRAAWAGARDIPRPRDVWTSVKPWPHGRRVRVEVCMVIDGQVWWRRVGVDHLAVGDEADFVAAFSRTAAAA